MSTEPATRLPLDTRWRKAPGVALRLEPFGAMANDFESRRLYFLKSRKLADVVAALDGHTPTLDACRAAGVSEPELPSVVGALASLARRGMLLAEPLQGVGRTDAHHGAGSLAGTQSPTGTHAGGAPATGRIVDRLAQGLAAPICITWELTYACNLQCGHCLSSSGRRDPAELSTGECERIVDDLARMGVFYANVGGGEPTIRSDFWHLVEYAGDHGVGIKFSTNGTRIGRAAAALVARSPLIDVQISLDGATAEVNDALRGTGTFDAAVGAMEHLSDAGYTGFKLSVVATRHNIDQLTDMEALAARYGAQLRVTRLRPSGRAAAVWDELHPTPAQQEQLYTWLQERRDHVLTGDSFFHLGALGEPLPGLNMCGAGKIVCLIDPVGDVYACPFTIHETFRAGNVRADGGFAAVWRHSEHFAALRAARPGGTCAACSAVGTCGGGCMAAKFFTGRALDDPDPECVRGQGPTGPAGQALTRPRPTSDHSHRATREPVALLPRAARSRAGGGAHPNDADHAGGGRAPVGASRA